MPGFLLFRKIVLEECTTKTRIISVRSMQDGAVWLHSDKLDLVCVTGWDNV